MVTTLQTIDGILSKANALDLDKSQVDSINVYRRQLSSSSITGTEAVEKISLIAPGIFASYQDLVEDGLSLEALETGTHSQRFLIDESTSTEFGVWANAADDAINALNSYVDGTVLTGAGAGTETKTNTAIGDLSGNGGVLEGTHLGAGISSVAAGLDILDDAIASVSSDGSANAAAITAIQADDWVTSDRIADNAVVSANIVDGTIVNADVNASAAIAASKLDLDGAITSTHLADGTIVAADLADDAVTAAKLAGNAVVSASIVDGSIVNADVNASAAIAASKLDLDGAITSTHLTDGTIVNADINQSAAIAASKLDLTGAIVNADVNASAAIAASKLDLDGAITSTHLTDGTIVNADINQSAAIAASKLDLTGAIVNADVNASAAIAASKLDLDGAITSTHLTDGTIVNADVNASAAIAASKLDLTGAIVNADVNASAAIAASKLDLDGAITSTHLTDGTIVNADINQSAAIAASKLDLTGAIVNADVNASAAIAASKLDLDGAITSTHLTDGTIVNADINQSAAIAASKLASEYANSGDVALKTFLGNDALTTDATSLTGAINELDARSTGTVEVDTNGAGSGGTSDVTADVAVGDLTGATGDTLGARGPATVAAGLSALDTDIAAIKANNWVTQARMADDSVGAAELVAEYGNSGSAELGTFLGTAELDTTATSLSAAINEVHGEVDTNTASIATINADDWVTTARIADGAVDTSQLAVGAVTYAKLALENQIADTDLAANSVGASELKNDAVTGGHILDGTIANADINASAAIAASKLASEYANSGDVALKTFLGNDVLTTTASDLTGAINELDAEIGSGTIAAVNGTATTDSITEIIGNVALDTTAKTLSGAIVELNAEADANRADLGATSFGDEGTWANVNAAIGTTAIAEADVTASIAQAESDITTLQGYVAGTVDTGTASASTSVAVNTAIGSLREGVTLEGTHLGGGVATVAAALDTLDDAIIANTASINTLDGYVDGTVTIDGSAAVTVNAAIGSTDISSAGATLTAAIAQVNTEADANRADLGGTSFGDEGTWANVNAAIGTTAIAEADITASIAQAETDITTLQGYVAGTVDTGTASASTSVAVNTAIGSLREGVTLEGTHLGGGVATVAAALDTLDDAIIANTASINTLDGYVDGTVTIDGSAAVTVNAAIGSNDISALDGTTITSGLVGLNTDVATNTASIATINANNWVTSARITDGAVTAAKLADVYGNGGNQDLQTLIGTTAIAEADITASIAQAETDITTLQGYVTGTVNVDDGSGGTSAVAVNTAIGNLATGVTGTLLGDTQTQSVAAALDALGDAIDTRVTGTVNVDNGAGGTSAVAVNTAIGNLATGVTGTVLGNAETVSVAAALDAVGDAVDTLNGYVDGTVNVDDGSGGTSAVAVNTAIGNLATGVTGTLLGDTQTQSVAAALDALGDAIDTRVTGTVNVDDGSGGTSAVAVNTAMGSLAGITGTVLGDAETVSVAAALDALGDAIDARVTGTVNVDDGSGGTSAVAVNTAVGNLAAITGTTLLDDAATVSVAAALQALGDAGETASALIGTSTISSVNGGATGDTITQVIGNTSITGVASTLSAAIVALNSEADANRADLGATSFGDEGVWASVNDAIGNVDIAFVGDSITAAIGNADIDDVDGDDTNTSSITETIGNTDITGVANSLSAAIGSINIQESSLSAAIGSASISSVNGTAGPNSITGVIGNTDISGGFTIDTLSGALSELNNRVSGTVIVDNGAGGTSAVAVNTAIGNLGTGITSTVLGNAETVSVAAALDALGDAIDTRVTGTVNVDDGSGGTSAVAVNTAIGNLATGVTGTLLGDTQTQSVAAALDALGDAIDARVTGTVNVDDGSGGTSAVAVNTAIGNIAGITGTVLGATQTQSVAAALDAVGDAVDTLNTYVDGTLANAAGTAITVNTGVGDGADTDDTNIPLLDGAGVSTNSGQFTGWSGVGGVLAAIDDAALRSVTGALQLLIECAHVVNDNTKAGDAGAGNRSIGDDLVGCIVAATNANGNLDDIA